MISLQEKNRLRDLAKRQLEIANLPVMKEREKKWFSLNNGNSAEPLVTFEYNGPPEDIFPASTCSDALMREIEFQMNAQITNHELLNDDRVIPAYISVNAQNNFVPFGYDISDSHVTTTYADGRESMGYGMKTPIDDLEDDFHILGKSTFSVDSGLEKARKMKDEIEDVLGDILPVRIQFPSFYFCLSGTMLSLMGMEKMMLTLYDYPDLFHKAMQMLVDDYLEYMDAIEEAGAILSNNNGSHVGQGSWGYTDDLPDKTGEKVRFCDVWGYTNSQETVGINTYMFDEFFFSYMEKITERFGLLSYGCCEAVDGLWDVCLSRLTNLRKLSVSPWCNEERIGELIQGKKIVYHRKPMPNFISVDPVFDEDAFRKHIVKTIHAAKGCPLEITFRDVISTHGEPWRLTKAIRIVKEEYVNHWKG